MRRLCSKKFSLVSARIVDFEHAYGCWFIASVVDFEHT